MAKQTNDTCLVTVQTLIRLGGLKLGYLDTFIAIIGMCLQQP